jgi:hypothetical protein
MLLFGVKGDGAVGWESHGFRSLVYESIIGHPAPARCPSVPVAQLDFYGENRCEAAVSRKSQ